MKTMPRPRDKVEAENRKQRKAYEKMRDEFEMKYGKLKKASQ